MKRVFGLGLFGSLFASLLGCPLYGNDSPAAYSDTGYGAGYDGYSECTADYGCCSSPLDCDTGFTCGSDEACHPGDCSFWGCVAEYTCAKGSDGYLSCTSSPNGSGGAGGSSGAIGGGGDGTGGAGGLEAIFCGSPDDCGETQTCATDGTCTEGDCSVAGCVTGFTCEEDGSCAPENTSACSDDLECISFGEDYKCVSGICTAKEDQCFDQTQCDSGKRCMEGKCITACSDDTDCPASYSCDTALGTCSLPKTSCTTTEDCASSSLVCVEGACVPRSDDGTCPAGEVWVDNGCIPNQSATFTCTVDGTEDVCLSGSICLHHSCYISCDAPNEGACDNLASFDICKSVTSSSGSHNVCGSSDNLGGECDPTAGIACGTGFICVDGFCK